MNTVPKSGSRWGAGEGGDQRGGTALNERRSERKGAARTVGKGFLPGTVMVGVVSFRQVYEARCLKSVILRGSSLDLARLEREMVVMVVGAMAR